MDRFLTLFRKKRAESLKHIEPMCKFDNDDREVQFVLAYAPDKGNQDKRATFIRNLEKEGLQLMEFQDSDLPDIRFIKIHAPTEVLERYAEILKMRLIMKEMPGIDCKKYGSTQFKDLLTVFCGKYFSPLKVEIRKRNADYRTHHEFSRNCKDLFDWQHPNFYNAGVRNAIINFILERQRFEEGAETPDNKGIEKLLEDGVFDCAYPLHAETDRQHLLSEWANLKQWIDLQPLDDIQRYFGSKVALYFAWLGFYTHMLIPLSLVGVICFIYGIVTWNTDPISRQICNNNSRTIVMCPQCDRNCDFWELSMTCKSSKFNYLLDNNMTIMFAIVLSVWSVMYLELWKRYSAGLIHRWGLTDFSQHIERPQPRYLAKVYKSGDHQSHKQGDDPDLSFWKVRFLPSFTSYSIVILFICISLIAISSVVVYRMAQKASHSIVGSENGMTYKIMVLPITAGLIDVAVISMLDFEYKRLAIYLTNMEYCRTQTDYDNSLTIKNYVFQFFNYYSSLFYIAFLKGKFVGYPAKYNRILGFRQEECNPGGCLMELCVQLVIIMVGKQPINSILEMLSPWLGSAIRKTWAYFDKRKNAAPVIKKRNMKAAQDLTTGEQCAMDYDLMPWTNSSLFEEYLEMVMQFGFIVLFGLAFPLAPLLALINNVLEVRTDAIKMLTLFRRPVAQRARNIGVWYNILAILTKIAVASSAMIIAFSTNFIPKHVYKAFTGDEALEGYLNFTLAYFNTADFQIKPVLKGSLYENITTCRYAEFRNPPSNENPYKRPMIYWIILTWRLAFIVIFQNAVGVIQTVIAWAIPNQPRKLRKWIQREDFQVRERIIEYGQETARKEVQTVSQIPEQFTNSKSERSDD